MEDSSDGLEGNKGEQASQRHRKEVLLGSTL